MKKYIFSLLSCLIGLLLCVSCFNDDSTSISRNISDIELTGIELHNPYTAFLQTLDLTPILQGDYEEEHLDFVWTLYNSETGKLDGNDVRKEPEVIGNGKHLIYPINLRPGTYKVRLTVTSKENGYSVSEVFDLQVVTETSQGFYALKETSGGDSDLDLLTASGNMLTDVVTKSLGTPVSGKPLNLSMDYGHYYVDEETEKVSSASVVAITTENKEIAVLRGDDLKLLFDRSSLLYGSMEDDEVPYIIARNGYQTIFISSKGVYQEFTDGLAPMAGMAGGVGKYSFPLDGCQSGSPFVVGPNMGYGMCCWDDVAKSFISFNMSSSMTGGCMPVYSEDYSGELTQNLMGYCCLAAGINYPSGYYADAKAYYLMEDDNSGQRYIYILKIVYPGLACSFEKRVALKKESHMAKATGYSVNAGDAQYIYCVDEGTVYACNLNSNEYVETPVLFEGLPGGEKITYVSNQYWDNGIPGSQVNFNYLIVGTQSGNGYKVYMYEMLGGLPKGQPVKTMQGEGKLKCVRYLSGTSSMFFFDTYPFGD